MHTFVCPKTEKNLIVRYLDNRLLVYKIFLINDYFVRILEGNFWATTLSSKLGNIDINDTFCICSDWSVVSCNHMPADNILSGSTGCVSEENMAVYRTRCDVCHSEFDTTTALIKQREAKHSGAQAIMFLPF